MADGSADPVEDAAVHLDRVIRAEIDSIAEVSRMLAERSRRLGESGRGANGLQAATQVWARDFEAVAGKVAEEGPQVSKALLGKVEHEVITHVNAELAAAAASDPARKR